MKLFRLFATLCFSVLFIPELSAQTPMQTAQTEQCEEALCVVSTDGLLIDSIPNLFLSTQNDFRPVDRLDTDDPFFLEKQMACIGILAGRNDSIVSTSCNINLTDPHKEALYDFSVEALRFRRDNPAMWRGTFKFTKTAVGDANVLIGEKEDVISSNKVLIVFADADTTVPVHGYGAVDADAWRPEFIRL